MIFLPLPSATFGPFLKPLEQIKIEFFSVLLTGERQTKKLADGGPSDDMVDKRVVKPLAENISKRVRNAKMKVELLLINRPASGLSFLLQAVPLHFQVLENKARQGHQRVVLRSRTTFSGMIQNLGNLRQKRSIRNTNLSPTYGRPNLSGSGGPAGDLVCNM